MALLRGWATDAAGVDGQHAALVVRQREAVAAQQGVRELLMGFKCAMKQQ
jgi:hypothetical protein